MDLLDLVSAPGPRDSPVAVAEAPTAVAQPEPVSPLKQARLFDLDDIAEYSGLVREEGREGKAADPLQTPFTMGSFATDAVSDMEQEVPWPDALEGARLASVAKLPREFVDDVPYGAKKPIPAGADLSPVAIVSTLAQVQSPSPTDLPLVRLIQLPAAPLGKTKGLGAMLSRFVNTQVLVIRDSGLKNLDGIHLADLLVCDLNGNAIDDMSVIRKLAEACPRLRILEIRGNPLVNRSAWTSKRDQLLARLPYLQQLNGERVGLRAMADAMDKHGTPQQVHEFNARAFSDVLLAMAQQTAVARGLPYNPTSWQPAQVLCLNLSGHGLQEIHVGSLVNLQELDVSRNALSDLTHTGLAACRSLCILDVSDNAVGNDVSVEYLSLLPSLLDLRLNNNPLQRSATLRSRVIYWTAQGLGAPTAAGLQALDRMPVALPERVLAMQSCYSRKSEPQKLSSAAFETAVGLYFTRCLLVELVGQRAVHDWHPLGYTAFHNRTVNTATYPLASLLLPPVSSKGPLTNFTSLHLPGAGLTVFDARGMVNLEELNLEDNRLTGSGIIGLGGLTALRVLNVSGNPELVRSDVLSALLGKAPKATKSDGLFDAEYEPLHNLELLSLGWSAPKKQGTFATWWEDRKLSPFSTPSGTNIEAVVLVLVPHNKYLRVVDGLTLPPPAIAAAYKRALHWSTAVCEEYLVRLAVCMCCATTMPLSQRWQGMATEMVPELASPVKPAVALEIRGAGDATPAAGDAAPAAETVSLDAPGHVAVVDLDSPVVPRTPVAAAPAPSPRPAAVTVSEEKAAAPMPVSPVPVSPRAATPSVIDIQVGSNAEERPVPAEGAVEEKEGAPELNEVDSKGAPAAAAETPRPEGGVTVSSPAIPPQETRSSPQSAVESGGLQLNALSSPVIQRRSHHPKDVYVDVQYVPEAVTLPINLSMMSLRVLDTSVVNLARFRCVTVLVLAHNKLADISECGLHHMEALRLLDLHDNAIKTELPVIGAILAQLPNLQAVALRDNPCMRSSSKRRDLLRYIPSLWQSLDCPLGTIDTPLTLSEVVEAWQGAGGTEVEAERFRWFKVMREVCGTTAPDAVISIDVSGQSLSWVDLTPFVSLEKLDLSKNRFTIEALAAGGSFGLCGLGALKELNLSGNPLIRSLNKAKQRDILFPMLNTLSSLERLWLTQSPSQESKCSVWWLSRAPAEGRPGSPTRGTVSHFRSEILSSFPMLQELHCPFRELDNQEIETWEVAECVHGRQKTEEKELFRFQLCVARSVGRKPVEDLVELTLSSCNLYALDGAYLAAAVNLRTLKLGYNHLNDAALEQANLGALRIRELDIQANPIGSMATIGAMVQGNRRLVELLAAKSSCFSDNSSHYRVQLLTETPRCALQGFRLLLNDVPVSIEERLMAVKEKAMPIAVLELEPEGPSVSQEAKTPMGDSDAATPVVALIKHSDFSVCRLRLALEVVEAGCTGQEEELDLSKKKLDYVADLAWHAPYVRTLHTLNLSGNMLTSLKGQGLGYLTALTSLDVSGNWFANMDEVLPELEKCANLTVLRLQATAKGTILSDPSKYTDSVFERLRGLESCDGVPIPEQYQLTAPQQQAALQWLRAALGVHANTVTRVDLRHRQLTSEHYQHIIAALSCLPVAHLWLQGNPCESSCDGMGAMHRLVTVQFLKKTLVSLDDKAVDADEASSAVTTVEGMLAARPDFAQKHQWEYVMDSPLTVPLRLSLARMTKHYKGHQYLLEKGDRNGPFTVGFDAVVVESADLESSFLSRSSHQAALSSAEAMVEVQSEHKKAQPQAGDAIGLQASNLGDANTLQVHHFLMRPGPARAEAPPAPVFQVIQEATGTMLNKIEVAVHFFQMYALMVLLTLGIHWPTSWNRIKSVFDWPAHLFSIDIVGAFAMIHVKLSPNLQIYARFSVVMALPILCFALYWKARLMNSGSWVRDYVLKWPRTKRIAQGVTLFGLVGVFALGLFYDYPTSWHRVTHGHDVTPETHTIWLAGGVCVLFLVLLYFAFIIVFRRKYYDVGAKDPVIGGDRFVVYWGFFTRTLRRAMLFFLTVSYLPVARVTLENFSAEYSDRTLALYGCKYLDKAGHACCLKGMPNQPCLGSPNYHGLNVLQIISIVFVAIYVIGLPLFFVSLVREGVNRVDRQYLTKDKESRHHEELLKADLKTIRKDTTLPKADRRAAIKDKQKQISDLQQHRRDLFATYVQQDENPQKYLYQAYQRHFKFYKIYQMMEKLALLGITLYTPESSAMYKRLSYATALAALSFLLALFFRPLNDPLEAWLDVTSRLANMFNCGIGLITTAHWYFPPLAINICMIGVNALNMGLLVFVLLVGPIRGCLAKRKYKRKLKEALEGAKNGVPVAVADDSVQPLADDPTATARPVDNDGAGLELVQVSVAIGSDGGDVPIGLASPMLAPGLRTPMIREPSVRVLVEAAASAEVTSPSAMPFHVQRLLVGTPSTRSPAHSLPGSRVTVDAGVVISPTLSAGGLLASFPRRGIVRENAPAVHTESKADADVPIGMKAAPGGNASPAGVYASPRPRLRVDSEGAQVSSPFAAPLSPVPPAAPAQQPSSPLLTLASPSAAVATPVAPITPVAVVASPVVVPASPVAPSPVAPSSVAPVTASVAAVTTLAALQSPVAAGLIASVVVPPEPVSVASPVAEVTTPTAAVATAAFEASPVVAAAPAPAPANLVGTTTVAFSPVVVERTPQAVTSPAEAAVVSVESEVPPVAPVLPPSPATTTEAPVEAQATPVVAVARSSEVLVVQTATPVEIPSIASPVTAETTPVVAQATSVVASPVETPVLEVAAPVAARLVTPVAVPSADTEVTVASPIVAQVTPVAAAPAPATVLASRVAATASRIAATAARIAAEKLPAVTPILVTQPATGIEPSQPAASPRPLAEEPAVANVPDTPRPTVAEFVEPQIAPPATPALAPSVPTLFESVAVPHAALDAAAAAVEVAPVGTGDAEDNHEAPTPVDPDAVLPALSVPVAPAPDVQVDTLRVSVASPSAPPSIPQSPVTSVDPPQPAPAEVEEPAVLPEGAAPPLPPISTPVPVEPVAASAPVTELDG